MLTVRKLVSGWPSGRVGRRIGAIGGAEGHVRREDMLPDLGRGFRVVGAHGGAGGAGGSWAAVVLESFLAEVGTWRWRTAWPPKAR